MQLCHFQMSSSFALLNGIAPSTEKDLLTTEISSDFKKNRHFLKY